MGNSFSNNEAIDTDDTSILAELSLLLVTLELVSTHLDDQEMWVQHLLDKTRKEEKQQKHRLNRSKEVEKPKRKTFMEITQRLSERQFQRTFRMQRKSFYKLSAMICNAVLYPILQQHPEIHHEELKKLVTLKKIAGRSKTEKKRIYEGHVLEHGYHRQIFVHHMDTLDHELKVTNSKDRKLAASTQLYELSHVVKQTSIDIADNMFYAFHKFHLLPHGGCCRLTQQSTEQEVLKKGNNGNGADVHHIRMDVPKNISHNCARVLYPGSSELSAFDDCGLNKEALLDYVLTRGKFKARSRDSGFARRVTMGWTRKQTSTHPMTRYYKGVQLPLMNTKAIESMSHSLRLSLGKILLLANKTLIELFSDQFPLPFSDRKRNSICGHAFTSQFCKKYRSSWEFVDLFVESGGNLNRHMDYQNSGRSGYDYGCSYSYLITKDKVLYRVNIIMCARKSVDQSVDELKRNGKFV